MWKRSDRLYCLTMDMEGRSHADQAARLMDGGATLIQVRSKRMSDTDLARESTAILGRAATYRARIIINDRVEVATACGAHGVHLGKGDMPPGEARRILGDDALIGGTANTAEDIINLAAAGVDYMGLGPYRFTATKEGLSPLLGLDGITRVLKAAREAGVAIPVFAIGGIGPDDVPALLEAGVFGVAMASSLNLSGNAGQAVRHALQLLGSARVASTEQTTEHG